MMGMARIRSLLWSRPLLATGSGLPLKGGPVKRFGVRVIQAGIILLIFGWSMGMPGYVKAQALESAIKQLPLRVSATVTDTSSSNTSFSSNSSINSTTSSTLRLTSKIISSKRLTSDEKSLQDGVYEGSRVLTTDSLLRWQQWMDAGEWLAYQSGFRVYRLGAFGRSSAVMQGGWTLNRARVRWNGVPLNDPLSGQYSTADWPLEHLTQLRYDSVSDAFDLVPRSYRVVRPYTWIHYEQGRDAYRVLDGTLALPLTPSTRVQLSYQGLKDRGEYARSGMEGLRSLGQFEQVLGNQSTLKAFWVYRGVELEESLGYVLEGNPSGGNGSEGSNGDAASLFSFDRYRATAISSETSSHRQFLLTGLRWQLRGQGEEEGVLVYRTLNRDRWYADQGVLTTAVVYGMQVGYRWDIARIGWIRPELLAERYGFDVWTPRLQWAPLAWKMALHSGLRPHPWLRSTMHYHWGRRHDQTWQRAGAALALGPQDLQLHVEATRQQTPELRYRGGSAPGYLHLQDIIVARHEQGEVALSGRVLETGIRAGYRLRREDGVALVHSTVTPKIEYYNDLISNQFYIEFDLDLNHIEARGGYQQARWSMGSDGGKRSVSATNPTEMDQSLQLAGYYKSPVIGRAAYLKVGAAYRKTLEAYRSPMWIPQDRVWLRSLDGPRVPPYDVLDLEMAARVRSIILTARLENALDGWIQNGYFETLSYPMPSRRFRIGLKVVFRD